MVLGLVTEGQGQVGELEVDLGLEDANAQSLRNRQGLTQLGSPRGREVAVVGKLRLNEWTSRDGEKRSRIQVVAEAVQFLGSPTKAGNLDGGVAGGDDTPAKKPAAGAYRRKAS